MKTDAFSRQPRLTPQARLVLAKRYLRRDAQDRPMETPADMFQRVALAVAQAEEQYGPPGKVAERAAEFYRAMSRLEFLPNSPTLMNAGRDLGQLSACFVLPVEDSIESIFNAVRDTAIIHKSGGGTGFSFSRIRPARDRVQSTHGVSSGPISFMTVFDVATETIKQGGVRRGANMGLLSVHHPDIMDFITVKRDQPGRFGNFNLSVGVTQIFMDAVRQGGEIDLINPRNGNLTATIPAGEVFEQMVQSAWACGDPGLVFIDRINEHNPVPHLGRMEATNPCGEQPLLPYESCTLGSINLSRFVCRKTLDYDRLGAMVRLAVRFLDNVGDINRYPLPQIAEMTQRTRKIGLGIMGLADTLIRLGLAYDSNDALDFCRRIMTFLHKEALEASVDLARERGCFPAFDRSLYAGQDLRPRRNATLTTIAPTGSLSIIAGCSSGIEPLYAVAYRRRLLDDQETVEVHPWFRRVAKAGGFWTDTLIRRLTESGSVQGLAEVPPEVQRLFLTAHDLDPLWHLRVQAAFQERTDNAVSKTVNLPRSASPEVVRQVFLTADDLDLKGVTVYRDGSKNGQVLSFLGPNLPVAEIEDLTCPDCGYSRPAGQRCQPCQNCGYTNCR